MIFFLLFFYILQLACILPPVSKYITTKDSLCGKGQRRSHSYFKKHGKPINIKPINNSDLNCVGHTFSIPSFVNR